MEGVTQITPEEFLEIMRKNQEETERTESFESDAKEEEHE